MIDRVTFTGADDGTDVEELLAISDQYPWVEWGILFSKSHEGEPRYPSKGWIAHLAEAAGRRHSAAPRLSAHLCGRIMRDTMRGRLTWFAEYRESTIPFGRIQLNFHAEPQENAIPEAMHASYPGVQWIYQADGVNDDHVRNLLRWYGGSVLFDKSGGAGTCPDHWPEHWGNGNGQHDVYCGYAGGLGPDNIDEQLQRIRYHCMGRRTWIDMERKVRSDDDRTFDLDRVRDVIHRVEPWVRYAE